MASIARALGITSDAIGKWKRNQRYPKPDKPIINSLNELVTKKPPKKKLYIKGNRNKGGKNG